MSDNLIEFSPSAYRYPLLIKHLLHYPMTHAPDQEIVYRDLRRHSYRVFRERIGRLASGLASVQTGQSLPQTTRSQPKLSIVCST